MQQHEHSQGFWHFLLDAQIFCWMYLPTKKPGEKTNEHSQGCMNKTAASTTPFTLFTSSPLLQTQPRDETVFFQACYCFAVASAVASAASCVLASAVLALVFALPLLLLNLLSPHDFVALLDMHEFAANAVQQWRV